MKNIELKNNEIVIINGKKYLVGFSLFDNDISLHCLEETDKKN